MDNENKESDKADMNDTDLSNTETNSTDTYSAGTAGGDSQSAEPAGQPEKTNWKKEILGWIELVAICMVVVWFATNYVIVNARVPSGSMENTIMTGDRLIGFRLAYTFSGPKRGDIILFKYPLDESTIYIKRVIGLPGEKVTISDGKIYINDSEKPLEEDYLKEDWVVENDGYTFNVPENSYLVLGDNRNNSEDARYWAEYAIEEGLASTPEEAEQYQYVSKDKIIGKALFIYYDKFKSLMTIPLSQTTLSPTMFIQ